MSTIAPPVRGKVWVWQVTMLCVILGMLLALSLKTQRQAIETNEPTRPAALRAAYRIMKQQNVELEKELGDYKVRVEQLAKKNASGVYGTKDFQRMFEETKMTAGMVAVHGAGIVVVLHDSPKRNPSETRQDVVNDYIVHDRDIREIVNELFAAGAEAISVNGQRLVASSSIRCVGPVVLVNSTQVAAPFVIKALGKPETLENALKLPMGVADGLFLLDMIEITKEPDIVVPAYTGSTRFTTARPVATKSGD
jgi:uncharacterized protein YlxW (UPF0749 family)